MCSIAPEEPEVFSELYFLIPKTTIAEAPTLVIDADVVAGPQEDEFADPEARRMFMVWMGDNGGYEEIIFQSPKKHYEEGPLNESHR